VRRHQIQGFDNQAAGPPYAFNLFGRFNPDPVLFCVLQIRWLRRRGIVETAMLVFFPAAAGARGVSADFPGITSIFHNWMPLFFPLVAGFMDWRHFV
jgi:hypothetical protein